LGSSPINIGANKSSTTAFAGLALVSCKQKPTPSITASDSMRTNKYSRYLSVLIENLTEFSKGIITYCVVTLVIFILNSLSIFIKQLNLFITNPFKLLLSLAMKELTFCNFKKLQTQNGYRIQRVIKFKCL